MLKLFWNKDGVVAIHFTSRGETVNSVNYCDVLRTKLKPPIGSKCHGKLQKGVILQQDNARPHSAKRTAKTIKKLGFELLEHPLHSPNLAPSDFYTFGPLKKAVGGRRFAIDAEVMMLRKIGYRCNLKTFFFRQNQETSETLHKVR